MAVSAVMAAHAGDPASPPPGPRSAAREPSAVSGPGTVSASARLMGGLVGVHIRPTRSGIDATERAERDANQVLRRIGRWADRLTRFSDRSELSRLNASRSAAPVVGPTLAAVLRWGSVSSRSDRWGRGHRASRRPAVAESDPAVDVQVGGHRARVSANGPVVDDRWWASYLGCRPSSRCPVRPRRRGQGLAGRPRCHDARGPSCRGGRRRWRHRDLARSR